MAKVEEARGSPSNPLTNEELIEKFRDNAGYCALGSDKVEKAIETIYRLEKIDDIKELTALLTVSIPR